MHVSSSPKEASSELPQLALERNENDDDFEDDRPTLGKLNTPNCVREAAALSVSRWHWKFWKKSSPKQQRLKQRKRPLPGEILTPLPASSSPGRHNVVGLEKLSNFIADLAERQLPSSSPRSIETAASNRTKSPLPPLELQILERPRLFLDLNGSPTVAMEQLVRLQEINKPNLPVNALQLVALPKKCLGGDEIALMPCHSLQYRGYERLSAELWREPVRSRNKNWLQDELPFLVRGNVHSTPWNMTRAPSATNRGKWTRYAMKRPHRVLLRGQGALITRSYCVVSVFGEGIYGRIYSAGLAEKDKTRGLRVEAYEPATSRTYSLHVTLADIEWFCRVGEDDPEREAWLVPGRKQDLLHQLIALLYFEYPDESNIGVISSRGDSSTRGDVVNTLKTRMQVLKISPEIQFNESTLRRLEREERLRQEEAQRLEELAALLGKARRARHRVLCQTRKLRGRHFYVSIYHFPAQARNLVITAYNPSSSITYRLTIGLLEAASLVKLHPSLRFGFSSEQTLSVARSLLPRLEIYGYEDSRPNARMMLAISGGRKGPGMSALPLLAPMMTQEQKRDELLNKMLRDSQCSLQLELEMTQFRLHKDAETERVGIRQKVTNLEAKLAEMNEKDQEHKIRIEEIDATGGGGGANVDAKRLRDERRALKAARQALKADMKAAIAQLTELNQQLQSVSEKEKSYDERAQRRANRARKRIREEVVESVGSTLRPTVPSKRLLRVGQRTWLARRHMQPYSTLLASGGCRISGKRVRYSLFALELDHNDALDTVDATNQSFSLELYDPTTCSRCSSFIFSRLEWLALTKTCHEQQQLVPELAPPTSPVAKRFVELCESMKETRQALFAVNYAPNRTSFKGKASKTKAPSSKKKHEGLYRAIAAASNEIHQLNRAAPWSVLIKALCARCSITPTANATAFQITLDRCLFRAVSPVLRLKNDENEHNKDGESSAVYCRVRAEVLPVAKAVVFEVWDPYDGVQWRIEYAESRELLREFAVETFIEQQMHLEAITMSLLLHPNAETGHLELRFED